MALASPSHRGRGLEAALDLAHDLYWKRERILIRHYGISGRWFGGHPGEPPRFVSFPKDQQPVDYHGCLRGRLVVFDAKQEKRGNRWRLDKRYAHQHERLQSWAASGAIAFFAIEAVSRRRLFLLRIRPESPWPALDFAAPLHSDVLVVRPNEEGYYDWLTLIRLHWL